MNRAVAAYLKTLLTERRVLAVAVVDGGEPIVGLLSFAPTADFQSLIVNVSHLARHTRGLFEGAPFDALVQELDLPDADPLQLPRVTLRGRARVPATGTPSHAAAREAYLARFPEAEPIVELGGFRLVRLEIEAGRIITGFAGAADVSPADLAGLARV